LRKLKEVQRLGLVCHHNADPDSLLSAEVLKRILGRKLSCEILILAPAGVSSLARRMYEAIYGEEPLVEGIEGLMMCDVLGLVDVSTLEQLGHEAKDLIESKFRGKIFIVDHHEPHERTMRLSFLNLIEPTSKATAIIVHRIAMWIGVELSKEEAEALMAAILHDTRHLNILDIEVLEVMKHLLERGADYNKVNRLFRREVSISERIARLKAAQRLKLYRVSKDGEDLLICISQVSAFEASAARALIELGADLALVIGGKGEDVRICARASPRFLEVTGTSLGKDVMMEIGKIVGGGGGGHDLAAGLNVRGSREEVLKVLMKVLEDKLKTRLKEYV